MSAASTKAFPAVATWNGGRSADPRTDWPGRGHNSRTRSANCLTCRGATPVLHRARFDGPRSSEIGRGNECRDRNGVGSRVAVLAQEEPQLIRRNLECRDQAAEHVANAVGGQVAFHEEPLVDLEGFAE